jgi:hypothetical protein
MLHYLLDKEHYLLDKEIIVSILVRFWWTYEKAAFVNSNGKQMNTMSRRSLKTALSIS